MFRDRVDAGLRLAEVLQGRELRDPLVLAIPRGGVVIGAVLARELGAELDVVLARKLRWPGQPELAMGAVAESGEVYLQDHPCESSSRLAQSIEEERHFQLAEIARRQKLFRAVRPGASVRGRSVIVADDGIATGSTMIAALKVVRGQGAAEVIAAVPVGSPDRLEEVGQWCDEVVCLSNPEGFAAISQFYNDFSQVEDTEVVTLLERSGRMPQPSANPNG